MLVLASACTGGTKPSPRVTTLPYARGGVLRLTLFGWMNYEFDASTDDGTGDYALDPQRDFGPAWELFRCCLVRTLMSYNGQPTGEGGALPRPDLADGSPRVSSDGLTWTFHLKRGLRYAPPFEHTEIRAGDIIRAVERGLSPGRFPDPDRPGKFLPINDSYDYLYWVIQGAKDYEEGKASAISGLETPNPSTLVVHLTQPTGDLPYRFAMPFTAPIPPDRSDPSAPFGVATAHEGGYGRFLVASGPYMIAGSQALDFSLPPQRQQPVSGYVPGISMTFVRNPSWHPDTDPLRPAYPDRIEFTLDTDREAHDREADDLQAGRIDIAYYAEGAADAEHEHLLPLFAADPTLAKRLFIYPADYAQWISMNMAVPPFDDVHVRKAVNLVMDKAAIQTTVAGGHVEADPATHLGWDSLEDNLLSNYDPYPTPGHAGSLAAAQAEMRQSRYDPSGDGRCDGPTCRDIRVFVPAAPGYTVGTDLGRVVRRNLAGIGLELTLHPLPFDQYFSKIGDPASHAALVLDDAAFKEFPNGSSFFQRFTDAPGPDHSLIGASRAELRRWGYGVTDVPNVTARYQRCILQTGLDQVRCWAELDQYLMEQVVPWVPLLVHNRQRIVSIRVLHFTYDQFTTFPSLDRIALRPGTSPTPHAVSPHPPGVPPIPAGVYRVAVSASDLRRFGAPTDDDTIRENTGTLTLTIGNGSWESVIAGPQKYFAPVNLGVYWGTGADVTFRTDRPFSNAVTLPPMRWTFDGAALHFQVVGCRGVSKDLCASVKATFEAHPWVKAA